MKAEPWQNYMMYHFLYLVDKRGPETSTRFFFQRLNIIVKIQ